MVRRDVSELTARARAGDMGAFAELYRFYLPDVRNYCERRVGDPHRAEELAQDVFERAWRSISRFESGRAVWPWLQAIASNLVIDEARRRAIVHLEPLEGSVAESIPSGEDIEARVLVSEERTELRDDLRVAFARLSPRAASIAWQRHARDVSYEQIAARYTTSIPSIRNTTWKATAALRTALREAGWRVSGSAALSLGLLQRLRQRVRSALAWTQARIGSNVDVSSHGATVMAFGLVVAVGSLTNPHLGRSDPPRPDRYATASSASDTSMETVGGGAQLPPRSSAVAMRWDPGGRDVATVDAMVRHRDQAVAPQRTQLTIEVRGPDGAVLYRDESDLDCSWDSHTLSRGSPVRVWC